MTLSKAARRQLFTLLLLVLIAQQVGLLFLGTGRGGTLYTSGFAVATCVLAIYGSISAFKRSGGVSSLFWLLFTGAFALQLVADAGWAYIHFFNLSVPDGDLFPSLWYRLYAVPLAITLFLSEDTRTSRVETFLDGCIVVGLVGLVMYQIQRAELRPQDPGIGSLVTLGAIVNFVLLLAAGTRYLLSAGRLRPLFRNLSIYLCAYSSVSFATSYVDAYAPRISDAFDSIWLFPYLVGGGLALAWRPGSAEEENGRPKLSRRAALLSFNLSMAFMVLGSAVLGLRSLDTERSVGLIALSMVLFSYAVRCALMQDSQEKYVAALQEGNRLYQDARHTAETANRAKSRFLSNMSHEVRTPLNGILGVLQLINQTELTAEQKELVTIAGESADMLLAVVNDVLDFSKIEAGKMELEQTGVELLDVMAEGLRAVLLRADEKKLALACEVDQDVPLRVMGDPVRLKQVLSNLLSNAVKFTDQGRITLGVKMRERSEGRVLLEFSVSDTGIGISPEQRTALFQAFTQADTSVTRKFGGTGLGLAICAKIIALMNGRIWVESVEGRGSTFFFTSLFGPCAPASEAPASQTLALQNVRAVLFPGQRSSAFLRKTLLSFGAEVQSPQTEVDALHLLDRDVSPGKSVLLFADHSPPTSDGFSVVQRIMAGGVPVPKTVLLTTSANYRETLERSREFGLAPLIQPFRPAELLTAAQTSLAESTDAVPVNSRPFRSSQRAACQLRVLVAEDNPINQKLAARMLQKLGYAVTLAHDGRRALEVMKSESLHAVLMDGHMPEKDGLTATREFREWEKTQGTRLPIIALTAMAMAHEKEACLEAGMDAFLSKPISMKDLERILLQVTGASTDPFRLDEYSAAGSQAALGTRQEETAEPPRSALPAGSSIASLSRQ